MSRAGKEVLIKTIAQAMPIYAVSVFLLPKELYEDIEKVLNAYWWKGEVLHR